MYWPRIAPRHPEVSFADAVRALDAAHTKFDAAVLHANTEAGKRQAEIDSLTTIVSEKTTERGELYDLADKAATLRNAIAGLA